MRNMLMLALLFMVASFSHAAEIRIGTGAGCSPLGDNIQAAIDAADPAFGSLQIKIARNTSYTSQSMVVDGKDVELIGGFDDCLSLEPTLGALTRISGQGGLPGSVIYVRNGATVKLVNLDLADGDLNSSGFGGGVDVESNRPTLVTLQNVLVRNNKAKHGGGISIRGTGASSNGVVQLHLLSSTQVFDNQATYNGGGLYCNNATLMMRQPDTVVRDNHATNQGGGIRLVNCKAELATSALGGTVMDNVAGGAGGGISITGERAWLDLFNVLPDRPTSILNNRAGGVGGGIEIGSSATVRGFDILIVDNESAVGGAGVATFDNDGPGDASVILTGDLTDAPDGAVHCRPNLECNRLSGNAARDLAGKNQHGSAVRCYAPTQEDLYETGDPGFSFCQFLGTRMQGNHGKSLIHNVSAFSAVDLNGVLLDSNFGNDDLIYNPNGLVRMRDSTVANNRIANHVIRTNRRPLYAFKSSDVLLSRCLIWQPGNGLVSLVDGGSIPAEKVQFTFSNSLSGTDALPPSYVVTEADMGFVDLPNGDFRLSPSSNALDFAPTDGGYTRDHESRNVDLEWKDNKYGAQDLGAFENLSANPIGNGDRN